MPLPASKARAPVAPPPPAASADYVPASAKPLMAEPSPKFLWRWRPDQWEVATLPDGSSVLVPMISSLFLKPGVNGVLPTRTSGEARTEGQVEEKAILAAREAGWRFLSPDLVIGAEHLPAGVAPGPYRRSTPVVHKGVAGVRWHDAWTTWSRVEGSPARMTFHRPLLMGWLAEQARAGVFGEAPPEVVSDIGARLTDELTRKRSLNMPPDLRKDLADEVQARIDGLKKAAEVADA